MVESWQWWMVGDPLHTFCLVQFQRRQSDRQTLVFAPPALIPCSFPYGDKSQAWGRISCSICNQSSFSGK